MNDYMAEPKSVEKAGYSVRVWVNNEDLERYKKLSERTDLAQTEIMTKVIHAGIEALIADGFRLNLPVEFEVKRENYALNEPRAVTPKRK
jgi:hypothetical protein